MQLKKIDKILLITLVVSIATFYIAYFISQRNASNESVQRSRKTFYETAINDRITHIAPLHGDTCNTGYSIANYVNHMIMVNKCRYPQLRRAMVGDVFKKDRNTNRCMVIQKHGTVIELDLRIEF